MKIWCVIDDVGLLTEVHEDKDKAVEAATRMMSLQNEEDLRVDDIGATVEVWEAGHVGHGFTVEQWGVVPA